MCISPIKIINNPLKCLHLDLILKLSTLQIPFFGGFGIDLIMDVFMVCVKAL
jgi:hypothetical protein